MEPGREDREDRVTRVDGIMASAAPQWSPVVKTGKTRGWPKDGYRLLCWPQWSPIVKTGKTDGVVYTMVERPKSRNGARS